MVSTAVSGKSGLVEREGDQEFGPGATPDPSELGYVERNRAAWNRWAPHHIVRGRRAWEQTDLHWGMWGTPESELQLLRELSPRADVIELGCGTAAISAWLARRSMRPVAVDVSPAQLRTAEELQREFQLFFPLIRANAEEIAFEDASFDLALSEYGASLWCNPRRWLPEASRVLRPGGRLVFFTVGAMLMACTPDHGEPGDRLVREHFSRYRVEFPGEDAVEFHVTHSHWIRLLRASGFELDALIEVRPPPDVAPQFGFVSIEWARRWPSEEIWIARKADRDVGDSEPETLAAQ